jgi:phosphatidylglycerol:prolipoprotein diacylglycerol transferase
MDAIPEQLRWILAMPIYAAAYAVAILAFRWLARRRGLDTEGMRTIMAGGLIGGLAGANLAQLIAAGTPGKTIEGGILGGFLTVIWLKRNLGITRPTGDMFALGIAAGEAVGRIGCFFAGCCYGKATTLPWGVYDHGMLRHPTQLYSSLAAALTLALLVYLERKRVLPENGLFYVQIAFLCALRFPIEFARDVPASVLGLTTVQVACILGFTFFTWRLARLLAKPEPARHAVFLAT